MPTTMIKEFSFSKHKTFIFHILGGLFLCFLIFGVFPNIVEATHEPECGACGAGGCASTKEICAFDSISFCATSVFCPVELVSPSDGSTVNTLTPTLDWNQSGGAVAYSINLIGGALLWNKIVTTDSGTVDSGVLANGGNYNWKVRACTELACRDTQPFSAQRSFTVNTPSCTGFVSISLSPNPASQVGEAVEPTASGLNSCSGKTIFFRRNSCSGTGVSSCTSSSIGCTGSTFGAVADAFFACIDKNSDGDFTDAGENQGVTLTISAPTTAPTIAPTTAPSCTGSVSISLSPNPASQVGEAVEPTASGLNSCSGKTIFFRRNSCNGTGVSSCTSSSTGCTGSTFGAESDAFFACIDKNSDGDFTDAGENQGVNLSISAPTPAPTIAPGCTKSDPGGDGYAEVCTGNNGTFTDHCLGNSRVTYSCSGVDCSVSSSSCPDTCTVQASQPICTATPTTAPGFYTISGTVWVDSVVEDAAENPGESGYAPGTKVGTVLPDGSFLETTTDGNGDYTLGGLAAGTYFVSFVIPTGFRISSAVFPPDNVESAIVPPPGVANFWIVPPPTPTATPQPTPTPTPAVYKIEGLVYVDSNKDGQPQAGEKAHSGATVNTTSITTVPTTTDADLDGNRINYSFTGLSARKYTVDLTVPPGFEPTTQTAVTVDLAVNPSGRADFGIADNTPPTVSVDHDPDSPKEGCSVTVTTTASDPESGIKTVSVLVNVNNNDAYEPIPAELLSCPSSPCKFNLPPLPAGKYKYYGSVYSNNPDPKYNSNSATEKEFTVTATKGTLQCLEASGCKCTKISTAIGPVDVAPAAFVSRIMSLLLGLGGGIAVLLIIAAGYSLITSRDNPQVVQDARERILAAIVGLLFVIFALVILQVIGFDILRIPGFVP